jgi:hypothetical protein
MHRWYACYAAIGTIGRILVSLITLAVVGAGIVIIPTLHRQVSGAIPQLLSSVLGFQHSFVLLWQSLLFVYPPDPCLIGVVNIW